MQTDTKGIEATELHGAAALEVMAAGLTLVPKEESPQQRVNRVLGPQSREEHRDLVADLNSRVTTNFGLWA